MSTYLPKEIYMHVFQKRPTLSFYADPTVSEPSAELVNTSSGITGMVETGAREVFAVMGGT